MYGVTKNVEKTRTHQYSTGAIYKGKWLGGMRNGKGEMKWADNASYDGNWSLN